MVVLSTHEISYTGLSVKTMTSRHQRMLESLDTKVGDIAISLISTLLENIAKPGCQPQTLKNAVQNPFQTLSKQLSGI
jgi:hypothetical protein